MRHGHTAFLLVLCVAAVTCAVSCGDGDRGGRAVDRPVELRLGIQDNAATGLVMLADARGDFRDHGTYPSIYRFPSGRLALRAMLDGRVDIATCADLPIVEASLRGDDVVVLATIARTGDGAWIVARKDRGIESAADLEGKRIATQKNSAVHFFLSTYLLRHYIPDETVDVVFMLPDQMVPALVAAEVDAFCMRNPYAARAMALLGNNAIELKGRGIYLQTFNLVTRRSYAEANPDLTIRLLRALVQAEHYADSRPDNARQTVALTYGPHREAEIQSDWERHEYSVRLEQSLILTLESQARWLLRQQGVDKPTIPNYLEYIYFEGLETVRPQAVDILH